MPQLTSVLKSTTIMVLVIIVALSGSEVTPEYVNCINNKEKKSMASTSQRISLIGSFTTVREICIHNTMVNNAWLQC